jgi:predicted dehydrogenase
VLEVEDSAVISMKFRNGALGQLLAATSMWPGSPRRIYIAGRDGTAEVLEDQLIQFTFRQEDPADARTRASSTQSLTDRVEELIHQAKLDRKEALKLAAKERGLTRRAAYAQIVDSQEGDEKQ